MDKIEEFYYEDGPESGEKLFFDFAERHHTTFEDDIDAEGTEHKLEYTTIFQEYQGILQTHIERLVTSCNCTTEEFNNALATNHDGETPLYVDIILAADDYLNFIHMMKRYKEETAEERAGGAEAEAQPAAGTGDSAQ